MPEKHWTEPSPSDWDRWEARLQAGEEPSTAAKAEGQTCSAFRRQDPDRQAAALAMSREARGHYADERAEAWSQEPDADDRMRERWLRRWQPAYAANAKVELVGEGGGPVRIEHERRLTLADVAAFARSLDGPGDSSLGELPAPSPVLAEPPSG